MAIENLDDILITDAEKESVRKNSPSALPLNPTAQGWSAQKIREKIIPRDLFRNWRVR